MTSANVVGYREKATEKSAYVLYGGMFITAGGGAQQFALKDIAVKVTATYEPKWIKSGGDYKWQGGLKAPNFKLTKLTGTGAALEENTVYWQYWKEGTQEEPIVIQGWYKKDGTAYVALTETELAQTYPAGQGFYILGKGCSIVPAGEVSKIDVSYPTEKSSYVVVGNGTPVDLTLGDLDVTVTATYEPKWIKSGGDYKWQGGLKAPNFKMTKLTGTGAALEENTVYWQYWKEGTQEEPIVIKGWYKTDGTAYVALTQEELDAFEVPAGQCYYVLGKGCTLNFPAPELD